jgi:hypothetical protein
MTQYFGYSLYGNAGSAAETNFLPLLTEVFFQQMRALVVQCFKLQVSGLKFGNADARWQISAWTDTKQRAEICCSLVLDVLHSAGASALFLRG